MRPCLPLLTTFALLASFSPVFWGQQVPLSHPTVLANVDSSNCPVRFAARRWNDVSALKDVGSPRTGLGEHGIGEHGLLLRPERDVSGKDVRFATVVVHGSASSLHLDPASSSTVGNLRQTFHLAELPRDRDGNWKLTTDRVPLVQQIEITEMHFADGSVWRESAGAQCRTQPDGYLPVASLR